MLVIRTVADLAIMPRNELAIDFVGTLGRSGGAVHCECPFMVES